MNLHHLLLVFTVPATSGRERIAALIESSKAFVQFQNFSGLYKRFSNQRREDLNAELLIVAHAQSELLPFELNQKLQQIVKEIQHRQQSVALLACGENISLLPQLTIPHPSLIEDQLILLCAAEACADFVHPILNKNLKDLLHGVSQSPLAEFVSQPHFLAAGLN